MKISIVMATYNGEKYLAKQLYSILKQSRKAEEVLIFDDGSKDRTAEIIQKFIEKNNLKTSWFFEKNSSNKGCTRNFLDGIQKSNGDLIFYCDQDDIWEVDKLEIMEKCFLERQETVACFCRRIYIDANGKVMHPRFLFMSEPKWKRVQFQKLNLNESVKYNKSPGLCLAFKRELVPEIYNLALENKLTHDLPVGMIASVKNGYYVVNKRLVRYRQHSQNISTPQLTFSSRISKLDFQLLGRKERYRQMVAIYKTYYGQLNARQQRNFLRAIQTTQKSIKYMKERNIVRLFLEIFNCNPMINNWILINNFVCCLMNR